MIYRPTATHTKATGSIFYLSLFTCIGVSAAVQHYREERRVHSLREKKKKKFDFPLNKLPFR